MIERLSLGAICLLTCLLASCGWVRDNASDYRQARELPPLQFPEGLDHSRIQSYYVIPPVSGSDVIAPGDFEVPRPEPVTGTPDDQAVRIQKLGDEQWALVQRAPDQTWPLVKQLMDTNRIPLAMENGQQGIMVTDALRPDGGQALEYYLIRIDAGVQRGTAEIHVRQQRFNPGQSLPATWPARSDSRKRESAFLYQLATGLAARSGEPSVSLLAQGIRAASKVSLRQDGGRPYLLLELPYDRAWASLGNALGNSGFTVADQDYSAGVFYVRRKADDTDRPGWWARLWGAEDDSDPDSEPWRVTLARRAGDAAEIRIAAPNHSLDVSRQLHFLNQIKGQLR